MELSHGVGVSVTRTRPIFPVFAFKVMHRVILLTRFYKLLTLVAIVSGGHVPQVPQWHDAPEKEGTERERGEIKRENGKITLRHDRDNNMKKAISNPVNSFIFHDRPTVAV